MIDETLEDDEVLRDPKSLEEYQPTYTQNKYRSINPEYLVYAISQNTKRNTGKS